MSAQNNQHKLVLHSRFGQGTVLMVDGETSVVRFGHGIEQVYSTELAPVISVEEAIATGSMAPPLEVTLRVQAAIIESVNQAWGVFTRSRISLLPHQLWVCQRAMQNWPIRLLIADDVGMGKTIEAGLLLWPLLASRVVQRVLILCPAKLVPQWQMRLKRMFDIRVATYHPELDTDQRDFWGIHNSVVASLPTLRTDRHGRHDRLLDAPVWDMVIVDEAHHLNADDQTGKTLGFELLERLNRAGKVTSCVLFTGTPHRGKNYGFWSLMSLVAPSVFGPNKNATSMYEALPRYLIRNAKQKATDMKGKPLFQPIEQYPETFVYSPAEESFYALMSEFILSGKAYASSLSKTERGQVMLVLIALQKLASSSIAAVAAALRTRVARLTKEIGQSKLNLVELDDAEEDESLRALRAWQKADQQERLQLMQDEGKHLEALILAANQVTQETRITRLVEIIRARFSGEPVLLFTEYKQTQALVVSALMVEFGQNSVGFMNGDDRLENVCLPNGKISVMTGKREAMCDAFNAGKLRFLVSTEAGGEGIDLQERCNALIHVDLPWNPMRLHQRVGRLNRYGQKRPVRVVSLRNPATVESMIWDKLEHKLHNIMQALGSAMDEPEDLLQLVLGMSSSGLFDELFSSSRGADVDEKLDRWFNSESGTLGGRSVLETVQTLVGNAASFDLSDLKDVPPLDLPDLLPFFQNALALNRRRPKLEAGELSFTTPENWLVSPAIRKQYAGLTFDRQSDPKSDLLGVGHPLLEQALSQAKKLAGTTCVLVGLDAPLLVFEITSKITSQEATDRPIITAIKGSESAFEMLNDLEILKMLNSKVFAQSSGSLDSSVHHSQLKWHDAASKKFKSSQEADATKAGTFSSRELAMFWPASWMELSQVGR